MIGILTGAIFVLAALIGIFVGQIMSTVRYYDDELQEYKSKDLEKEIKKNEGKK